MTTPKRMDAIVIGSGIGGLTAGALLARRGLKTLLLEKEREVGGYVVSFRRDAWTFDATGAFVGGCLEAGEFYRILKEIEAHREIDFIPVSHIRNIYPGFEVDLGQGGFDPYLETLIKLFPEEEKGLKDYLSLVRRIGEEIRSYSEISRWKKALFPFYFPNLMRYHRSSHQAILNHLFKGREIKMALHSLPATEPPSRLSFLFVATVITKALMEGVFYPKGGMGKISGAIAKSFLRHGGGIHLQTEVDHLLIKDRKVEGVLTREGRIFQAPIVISNVNPNLLGKMVPLEYQRPFEKRLRGLEYSLSCFILYLATDLDLKQMGLPYFTYLRSLSDLEEEARMFKRGEIPANPTMIVSIPTLLDPSLAPTGQHLLKVLVPVPYHYQGDWGKKDPKKYQQIKEEFSQRVVQQVESKLIHGLRAHLLFYETATPLTLERYTGNELGAMYGLASTPGLMGNSRPSHRTSIQGLFQVGHYTRPSHGIVGSSLSGLFAVRAILKEFGHDR